MDNATPSLPVACTLQAVYPEFNLFHGYIKKSYLPKRALCKLGGKYNSGALWDGMPDMPCCHTLNAHNKFKEFYRCSHNEVKIYKGGQKKC